METQGGRAVHSPGREALGGPALPTPGSRAPASRTGDSEYLAQATNGSPGKLTQASRIQNQHAGDGFRRGDGKVLEMVVTVAQRCEGA